MTILSRTQMTLAGLCAACLLLNFGGLMILAPGGLDLPEMLPLYAGSIFGQFVLLAVWGALSAEPITSRLPRVMALFTCSCYATLFGIQAANSGPPNGLFTMLGLLGLVVFVIVLLPLLLVRRTTSCVIRNPIHKQPQLAQFRILSILIWTAVIAALIAVGQRVFANDQLVDLPPAPATARVGLFVVILSVLVGMIGLPFTWVVLSEETKVLWIALLVCVFMFGVPLAAMALGMAMRATLDSTAVGYLMMFAMGVGAMTLTGLWTARCLGFRLAFESKPARRN